MVLFQENHMTHVDTISQSSPLGATVLEDGINFSVFSRSATGIELLFFDHEDDQKPSRIIQIDPWAGRTYHYWQYQAYGPDNSMDTGRMVHLNLPAE